MKPRKRAPGSDEDRALVESFLDMMSAERGASRNTLDAYRRDILAFAADCARGGASLKGATREPARSRRRA